jgi:hypothetical protein
MNKCVASKSGRILWQKNIALIKDHTWKLAPLSPMKNIVGCKWVYKIKFSLDVSIEKHKAYSTI